MGDITVPDLTPQPPLPPNTTAQEDVTTAGQRRINIIWEVTQAVIAIIVVVANIIVGVHYGLNNLSSATPPILSNAMFLVIGFYFSRTNHQAIGGIGPKSNENQSYSGR